MEDFCMREYGEVGGERVSIERCDHIILFAILFWTD
jgi:hypothetical protein